MGTKNKILIIAEIGHNHNGNIHLAKLLIRKAKECGADIAKFQVYDTDKILKSEDNVYPDLRASELSKSEVKELAKYCEKIGIEFMASAFDPERVKWIDPYVKRHKIASRSIYDTETIKAMEATGKPIIASNGMMKNGILPEIKNCKWLYCMAEYPATITEEIFPKKFNSDIYYCIGFSDHTIGIEWAKEAIRRGATIIEKHFTLDKRLPGCDQKGSANPSEMKELVDFAKEYDRQN